MNESGRKAIMRLSNGDMRSCLNILQVNIIYSFLKNIFLMKTYLLSYIVYCYGIWRCY